MWDRCLRIIEEGIRMIQLKDHDAQEAITWAYRLFLDREPESENVVEEKRICLPVNNYVGLSWTQMSFRESTHMARR
jgi:hypothetical protein